MGGGATQPRPPFERATHSALELYMPLALCARPGGNGEEGGKGGVSQSVCVCVREREREREREKKKKKTEKQ